MRRFLVILFLLSTFLFYPYASAGQEKDKAKIVVIDPDDTTMIHDWPLWLFNHGYTSYYDSSWSTKRGSGAIVIRKPLTFGESFLDGFGKGISKGMDNYYRARQQERDIKTTMALIRLKWAGEGKDYRPKFNQPYKYRRYTGLERARPLPEYRMSPEEKQANWERIIELGRIIKQKEERANLDKLFREAGWSDKDRIEYLDKYYPLPSKIEKEEDDLTKYMRSVGAVRPWEYKVKKLNEYLKSQGLPPVPENVDVNRVFDGEWVIYWDGEKWARKKKR